MERLLIHVATGRLLQKPSTDAAAVGYSCASAPYGMSARRLQDPAMLAAPQKSTMLRASCARGSRFVQTKQKVLQSSSRWVGDFLSLYYTYANDFVSSNT
jgi:hypothetical protein